MSKQKLIMESWRKFLKEAEEVKQIDTRDLMLFFEDTTDDTGAGFSIIIYRIGDKDRALTYYADETTLIGGIDVLQTDEPCIPKTMQIGSSYRNPNFRGQRIGDLLYDIAFYVANSMGYGLTSDRMSGTTSAASRLWNKFASDQDYEAKTTNMGNNEIDYDNSTPDDPLDDCEKDEDEGRNATDQSFIKKNADEIEPLFNDMQGRHIDWMTSLEAARSDNPRRFERFIKSEAYDLFQDIYFGEIL